MGVLLAVAGGVTRNAPMAAAGVAVGAYMGLHPVLLVVRAFALQHEGLVQMHTAQLLHYKATLQHDLLV